MELELEKRRQKAQEIAHEIAMVAGKDRLTAAVRRCGNDEELLFNVLDFLGELPTRDLSPSPAVAPDPMVNQKIGAYKIRWKLGGGGNGEVYLATRLKQPHQQVAIKFLRLEGESDEFRLRFLRERQIVALLSHPYIVKLFDADRTREGRPYFVMEHVAGDDIDEYAKTRRLPVEQRLDLFLRVCDAVQYLHSHLIIHRDLKPANVLVDGEGNPKILDFGIAKLLRPELMDGEPITMERRHPLTAQYASPEQWEGGLITSASDVYSLGVVLFEMLAGELPIPWTGKSYSEYEQLVCQGNIALCSKSIVPGQGALCRESSDAALAARLAGDLDAILSKALRKDGTERYPTVAALVDDIQRHLQFLPVRARGEGMWYRARRFLRRNRTMAASVAIVVLALTLGLGVALKERNEALRQEAVALEQTRVAKLETERVIELARHNEDVAQGLQQSLEKNAVQNKDLLVALQGVVAKIKDINQQAELAARSGRGEGPSSQAGQFVLLGRNYGVLGQLLTLSGDRDGARKAYQSCVANLKRAQDAGDVSPATIQAMHTCQTGL